MTEEQKIAFLEKEYFHLQARVESFDAKSLTIKAWSVSLAMAVLSSGAFSKTYNVLLYAAMAALLFWLIEGYWKTFQSANYQRIAEIEGYLNGTITEIDCLQINASWSREYNKQGRTLFYRSLFWPHVMLPHGIMTLGFAISYFYFI